MKFLLKNKVLILTLIFIFFGTGFYLQFSSQNKSKKSYNIMPVKKMDLVQRITIAGNVVPKSKTIITAPFNGYIKKLYVKVGDQVKKEDPIVSISQTLASNEPIYPLRSPLMGTVVEVLKDEGEYVRQNDSNDYILRIDNLDELFIHAEIPEIERLKIVKGQEVNIRATAISNKTLKGNVVEVSLASKTMSAWKDAKVIYTAKIKILDKNTDIKPGMSTIIDIITSRRTKVLVLPHEYIYRDKKKYFVNLKNGLKKEIEVGIQNDTHFEILSGLNEGDLIKEINFLEVLSGPLSK